MYALAASAAGVGVLAVGQPARAKIIYTPAHTSIANGTSMDLNHDHKADFRFGTSFFTSPPSSGHGWRLTVYPVGTKNRVWGTGSYASALDPGVRVGPNKGKLQQDHHKMGTWWYPGETSWRRGPWAKHPNGYLGVKFFIQGKAHYGWAHIIKIPDYLDHYLTGYAYETTPNKPIITGKTKGPDVITVQPATLGHLAAGASAIPTWRTGN